MLGLGMCLFLGFMAFTTDGVSTNDRLLYLGVAALFYIGYRVGGTRSFFIKGGN